MNLLPNVYNSFFAVIPNSLQTFATTNHVKAWALYVGVGGDVSVVGSDGVTALFKNVPSGTLLPIHVVEVNSAGTTASSILALYSTPRT